MPPEPVVAPAPPVLPAVEPPAVELEPLVGLPLPASAPTPAVLPVLAPDLLLPLAPPVSPPPSFCIISLSAFEVPEVDMVSDAPLPFRSALSSRFVPLQAPSEREVPSSASTTCMRFVFIIREILTGYEVVGLWWRIKTTTALAACAAKAVVEKEKA